MQILWNNLNLNGGWSFKIIATEEEKKFSKDLNFLSEIFPKYIVSKNSFLTYIGIEEKKIKQLENAGKIKFENVSWNDIPKENEIPSPTYLFPGNPYEGKSFII